MEKVNLCRISQAETDSPSQREQSPPTLALLQHVNESILASHTLTNIQTFDHTIAAITNEVFAASLGSVDGTSDVIVKVGVNAIEPRERMIHTESGSIGGWLKSRLKNEALLLKLLQNYGIPAAPLIHYGVTDAGEEFIIQGKIQGENAFSLRPPVVSLEDFTRLEEAKGRLLANIVAIPLIGSSFGPLSEASQRFATWREYFNAKLSTTLSLLYPSYDDLAQLQHFSRIASSSDNWQQQIEDLASLYSNDAIQSLLEKDGIPTVAHGDFWDANIIANKEGNTWSVFAIDLERGDISGKSFDLALWLAWKVGGKDEEPIQASRDFLHGYRDSGGNVSSDIEKYIAIYGLWQYLDFLLLDRLYGIDRTDESGPEITKLKKKLEEIVANNPRSWPVETVKISDLQPYHEWYKKQDKIKYGSGEKLTVQEVFGKEHGIVIDGLRINPAPHKGGTQETKDILQRLRENIHTLRDSGVDGVVIETNYDRPRQVLHPDMETLDYYRTVVQVAKENAGSMKVGLNIILFDLFGSLVVVKAAGGDFIVTDEFIDEVACTSSETAMKDNFRYQPQPLLFQSFRKMIGAEDVLVFAGTYSNYYPMIDEAKPMSASFADAVKYGADALVIGKNNATLLDGKSPIPQFLSGGVKMEDIPWINQQQNIAGFFAGSLFESALHQIDGQKTKEIVESIRI